MAMEKGDLFAENYIIISTAGVGGTATVYQAYDQASQAPVALKVFDKQLFSPEILIEVWNREVSALDKLNHTSIVKFITAGTDQETNLRYIVTEWLKGKSLEAQFLSIGAIAWSDFFRNYGDQLLDGLCYAFERNIIHRDISLKNVFILPNNKLKIIDFGTAKIGENPIGITVAEFKTSVFGPPEHDTGRHTYTRDPYSFSAIIVRALAGRDLADHDALYDALKNVKIPECHRGLIDNALSRAPEQRPRNVIEFAGRLTRDDDTLESPQLVLSIRCAPNVIEVLDSPTPSERTNAIDDLLVELNDTVALYLPSIADEQRTRIGIDTRSYRLTVDIDSGDRSRLVIIGLQKKFFQLDSLYKEGYWIPNSLRFSEKPPRTSEDKAEKISSITKLYHDFEEFLQTQNIKTYLGDDSVFDDWSRLLEALRFIASTEKNPLRYKSIEIEGRRVAVELANPQDAKEGEIRFISNHGRGVLTAEVEEVEGTTCYLYSLRQIVNAELIPSNGNLELDWRQARISLERQAMALDAFAKREIANNRLRDLVTLNNCTDGSIKYRKVTKYFDNNLDQDKKIIVSQFLATTDLLLIHGPPGTGKTRLIIELVKQQFADNKASKILLVSQTHVAIDNVLEPLLDIDKKISIVRIGSGSKELSKSAAKCSMDARGKQLLSEILKTSKQYIKNIALDSDVDLTEIEVGMRATEVLHLRRNRSEKNAMRKDMVDELEQIQTDLEGVDNSTITRSDELAMHARAQTLDNEITIMEDDLATADALLAAAVDKLRSCGKDGKALAEATNDDLNEWCDELLSGKDKRHIKDLLETSEDWHMQLEKSEDFRVAIIASTHVVAGTCIGFCRERAASSSEYDLCIVDEASKATTTELLVPMARAKKVVLVGDHFQLPAVVDHALHRNDIQEQYNLSPEQLEHQLFEMLQTGLPDKYKAELTTQHRMRLEIGNLISSCFYDGKLQNSESLKNNPVINLDLARLQHAVTWFDTDPRHKGDASQRSSGTSLINQTEVNCILALLRRIAYVLNQTNTDIAGNYTIGVISGYAAQTAVIRREIQREEKLDNLNISCDTVHAFQGRQVDICIYSITRNNSKGDVGFLSDWRHLNVALSRAKDYLVLVGGLDFCETATEPNPFRDIVNYVCSQDSCEVRDWINE